MKKTCNVIALTLVFVLTLSIINVGAIGSGSAPIAENLEISTYRNVSVGGALKATDPDGDVLVFQVSRKPAWAAFNPATGELSGTPSAGTTGTYTDITIFVSDGELKTALAPFTIEVTKSPATGSTASASLAWSAPTENEDGSPLTDLAGYRIYYGTSASDLSKRVDVGNPATTSTVVQNLTPGTWYFAISAYTQTGVESSHSQVASKVIG